MFDILFGVFYFVLLYMSIFLLITIFNDGESSGRSRIPKEWPFVSVIIPAFNESATIGRVVKSALDMDYPENKLEIIVVDDGSADGTSSIVKNMHNRKIKIVRQERKGKGAALNLGLDNAKGSIIACLDADSYVSRYSLKEMVVNFSSDNIAAVTPIMQVHNPRTLLEKVQNIEYLLAVYLKKPLSHMNSINVTPGPFSLYRADILRKIGKFDEHSIVEDQEIAYRIQENNYRIVQSDRGDVYTTAPKNLRDLYRQRKRWYKGSWLTFNKYRGIMLDRKYGDFGFFLMPNTLFGLLSCFFMLVFFAAYVLSPIFEILRHIYMAGFYIKLGGYINLGDMVSNFIFSTDFYKIFILWTFASITTFTVIRSHKTLGQKIGFSETASIATFLFIYYMFISFVNVVSTADLIKKDIHGW